MGLTGPPTGEKSRGRKVRFGGVSASRRCVRTPAPCVPAAPLNFQRISRWLSDVTSSPGTRRAPVKGEMLETLSTASGRASYPPFSAPRRSCADRGRGAHIHSALLVPGSAGWRGSRRRHPRPPAGLGCSHGEQVPL